MISVIVPVYNVEAYLARCLDSLLAQSCPDFEVLLIDDGSLDGSGKICDDYARKDDRIRVFHKQNGGLSSARNFGLDRMQGDCVTFVDSDDYLGRDCLKILSDMMRQNDADITSISFQETWALDTSFVESTDTRAVYDRVKNFREVLAGRHTGVMACGKLYKREMFDGIRFPVGQVYEDLFTTPLVMDRCERSVVSTSRQYYYFQRSDSLSNTLPEGSTDMWMMAMDRLLSLTEQRFPGLYAYAEARLVRTTFWWVIDRLLMREDYLERALSTKEAWGPHFKKAWRLPDLTFKERCKVTIFMISIRLFRGIRLPMLKLKRALKNK